MPPPATHLTPFFSLWGVKCGDEEGRDDDWRGELKKGCRGGEGCVAEDVDRKYEEEKRAR